MMAQNRKQIKLDPEAAAKKRIEVMAMLKKVNMRILPLEFDIEVFGDTEYPKMVKVDNDGRIDSLRIFSREEENALTNKWIDPEISKRAKNKVSHGNDKDSSAGD